MKNIQKILCPIDCSEPCVEALQLATELARHFEAELIVLNVVEPHASGADPVQLGTGVMSADMNERRLEADCELRDLIARHMPEDIRVHAEVTCGNPAEEIIERAGKGANLIVMATHGRKGLKRLMHGSVANKVLRCSPCPVLTVRWSGGNQNQDATHQRLRHLIADDHPGEAVGAARTMHSDYLEHKQEV